MMESERNNIMINLQNLVYSSLVNMTQLNDMEDMKSHMKTGFKKSGNNTYVKTSYFSCKQTLIGEANENISNEELETYADYKLEEGIVLLSENTVIIFATARDIKEDKMFTRSDSIVY